jgi:hypothetical protein
VTWLSANFGSGVTLSGRRVTVHVTPRAYPAGGGGGWWARTGVGVDVGARLGVADGAGVGRGVLEDTARWALESVGEDTAVLGVGENTAVLGVGEDTAVLGADLRGGG